MARDVLLAALSMHRDGCDAFWIIFSTSDGMDTNALSLT